MEGRRLEEIKITDFSRGYVDSVESELLPDEASPNCYNVICRTGGKLEPRPMLYAVSSVGEFESVQKLHSFYPTKQPLIVGTTFYKDFEENHSGDTEYCSFSYDSQTVVSIEAEEDEASPETTAAAITESPVDLSDIDEIEIRWEVFHLAIAPGADAETIAKKMKLSILLGPSDPSEKEIHWGETSISPEAWQYLDSFEETTDRILLDDLTGEYYVQFSIEAGDEFQSNLLFIRELSFYRQGRFLMAVHKDSNVTKISYYEDEVEDSPQLLKESSLESDYHLVNTPTSLIAFNGVDTPWSWPGWEASVKELSNAPRDGVFPVFHQGRVYVVRRSDPYRLNFSGVYDYNSWPDVNYMYIGSSRDNITNMISQEGRLIIFKDHSTYILTGQSFENFAIEQVSNDIGCVGPRAAISVGGGLFLVSHRGIMGFDGVNFEDLSSPVIKNLWESLRVSPYGPYGRLDQVSIMYWNNLLLFYFGSTPQEYPWPGNTLTLAYDLTTGAFWPWDISAETHEIFLELEGDTLYPHKYLAGSDSGVIKSFDKKSETVWSPTSCFWESKKFTLGYPEWYKKLKRAHLETQCDNEEDVIKLTVTLDGQDHDLNNGRMVKEREDNYISQFLLYDRDWWRYMNYSIRWEKEEGFQHSHVRSVQSLIKFKPRGKVIRGE